MTEANGMTAFRLNVVEQRVEKLDTEKAEAKDVTRLAEEVASLRRAILGFAFTVAVSAIAVAGSILVATHP